MAHQHCVKSVRIWCYSGPHFSAFGLNTERYGLSLCIQSECENMQTRITSNTDTFHSAQKIINLLGKIDNEASKIRTKHWVEVINDVRDAYMFVKGTMKIVRQIADAAAIATDRNDEQIVFINIALFTNCISEINNTQCIN